jgi:sugar (pentulose or hexulose) kinase
VEKTSVIGIDIGTSGCRAVVLDRDGHPLAEAALPWPQRESPTEQQPEMWWDVLEVLIPRLLKGVKRGAIKAIALDATSGTVLLSDASGTPLGPALMYNDNRATEEAARIATTAPAECAAHGTGSGLAKAMWLLKHTQGTAVRIHTQCDWLTGMFCGDFSVSDTNNVLKLGYDPTQRQWPEWLSQLGVTEEHLPKVVEPGTPIGTLRPELADRWELDKELLICAGTTDSTAAFIASGADQAGEAVTSLGSTLVLKILSEHPVFAPEYGIYSQPLGNLWLVGGGSNSGGAVLRHFFTDEQMAQWGDEINPQEATGLDYYPLLSPGERFPVNDAAYPPRLSPRPAKGRLFFQAMLEGIANIEKQGYDRLAQLGAPYPLSVRSNGGGARNPAWTQIRGNLLGVPMLEAVQRQACYGAARLARKGLNCPLY